MQLPSKRKRDTNLCASFEVVVRVQRGLHGASEVVSA